MGFNYLAKHGLNKHGLKTKNWSHLVGDQTVERERRKSKRREEEEEEEEEEKRKKRSQAPKRYGTMTINMNTCFGLYGTTLDKDFFN